MEINATTKAHKITMDNRRKMTLTGIKDVIAFDYNQVMLESTMGMIHIKGNNLKVTRLNVESGLSDVEGEIDSITYKDIKNFPKKVKSQFFKGLKV